MIIYNVTVKIDHSVHEDWLEWMRTTHIPDVMRTGCFQRNSLCRVIGDDNEHGITYAIQYSCENMAAFQRYQSEYAAALQQEHQNLYAHKYGAFRTLLEVVSSSIG